MKKNLHEKYKNGNSIKLELDVVFQNEIMFLLGSWKL